MAKNTKIYAEFMSEVKSANTDVITYDFGEKSFDVKLKTDMTVDEKSTFIDRVVNGCFDSNNEYRPEFRDAIFQITVLQMLSDVPVFTKKMKELDENDNETEKKIDVIDIDKTYSLCKKLNLVCRANDAFRNLINELVYLVETKIAFEQQRIIAGERKALEKAREELETGIALVNGIGLSLKENNKNMIDKPEFDDVVKLATKLGNLSEDDIIKAIIQEK